MQLSQERAYEVLSYCYGLDDENVVKHREWLCKQMKLLETGIEIGILLNF